MAKRSVDSFRRETARRLRLNQTDAEARLWRRLRHWPMRGTHFRRQVSIGPYIVDFACMAAHLVIEMDGSQHGVSENVIRDEARTRWLEAAGYRVIRFWNNDLVKKYGWRIGEHLRGRSRLDQCRACAVQAQAS
jgi:very-short-patch-repair endonuclease